MLKTRLWMGALLIGIAALVLAEGNWFAPWFPLLAIVAVLAAAFATRELLAMTPAEIRPSVPFATAGVVALILANWIEPARRSLEVRAAHPLQPWHVIGFIFLLLFVCAILREMRRFRGPDRIVERVAMAAFAFIYLGVLPGFLLQMRWFADWGSEPIPRSVAAIALAIFVPKFGDIGAYFTGKFLTGKLLGRNLMTPLLSPKKTWQGLIGGLLASAAVAVGIGEWTRVIPGGLGGEIAFGLSVGIAGVLGDLAESLIKRDFQTKDASQAVPGFGGVLDVIDSILFAAPVAYLWLG